MDGAYDPPRSHDAAPFMNAAKIPSASPSDKVVTRYAAGLVLGALLLLGVVRVSMKDVMR
jgi:hypothetical protein